MVASTEGWKGQEVAPAQTPDSLFKFKVTLNAVFIPLARPSVLQHVAVFKSVVIRGKHRSWRHMTVSCCYNCKVIMSLLLISFAVWAFIGKRCRIVQNVFGFNEILCQGVSRV